MERAIRAFISLCVFSASYGMLVSLLLSLSAENYAFRYGALTYAIDSQGDRLPGSQGTCFGTWSCSADACELAGIDNFHGAVFVPIAPFEYNSSCSASLGDSLDWTWQYPVIRSCWLLSFLAIALELAALVSYVLFERLASLKKKVAHCALLAAGPAALAASFLCYLVGRHQISLATGDDEPQFAYVGQIVAACLSILSVVAGRAYLWVPRSDYIEID